MPWYNGKNAEEYQSWAVKILEKLIDTCRHKKFNFIFDWTFWSSEIMKGNIDLLISKGYFVKILHIHFPPEIAWRLTITRE